AGTPGGQRPRRGAEWGGDGDRRPDGRGLQATGAAPREGRPVQGEGRGAGLGRDHVPVLRSGRQRLLSGPVRRLGKEGKEIGADRAVRLRTCPKGSSVGRAGRSCRAGPAPSVAARAVEREAARTSAWRATAVHRGGLGGTSNRVPRVRRRGSPRGCASPESSTAD